MTVGSLFTGIGGIDLGLERAGMRIAWQCENNAYCNRVLARHWPAVPNLGDVRDVTWSNVEPVDLICGGYPCQPFSVAGARKGTTDDRHLWPYFADAVRALRPRHALMENVPGHLSRGFGDVLGDLAELGYDAQWSCVHASDVGAPHRRTRVFIWAEQPRVVADTEVEPIRTGLRAGQPATIRRGRPGHRGRTHNPWTVEPGLGRVADGVPHRLDRLRGLGNAVVPQVAEWVGRMIVTAA